MTNATTAPKRTHKATYARDKRQGGYLIRVQGPHAAKFAGREVPVTMRSGEEHTEVLEDLIWTGIDQESAEPVALYHFESRPAEKLPDVEF